MLNIILTCRDILCVDLNVDKRCVDHSTSGVTVLSHLHTSKDKAYYRYLFPLSNCVSFFPPFKLCIVLNVGCALFYMSVFHSQLLTLTPKTIFAQLYLMVASYFLS